MADKLEREVISRLQNTLDEFKRGLIMKDECVARFTRRPPSSKGVEDYRELADARMKHRKRWKRTSPFVVFTSISRSCPERSNDMMS
jgi:hypothetical protein